MNNRESTKRRIKALLEKTTENGATEQEALSALKKAQELMLENFISENEINDPYLLEKCVFKETPIIKSRYNLTVFYASLCKLFDCEHYYNSKRITFFGFEEDTELCSYFYNFIIKACLSEKDNYMKSKAYKELSSHYHGKTLVASFIRGFLVGISLKMSEMYKNRTHKVSEEVGLMVLGKIEKVKEQFSAKDLNIRTVRDKGGNYEAQAYVSGIEKGENTSLVQGIKDHKRESILILDK